MSTPYVQNTTKMFLAELYVGKNTGDAFSDTILKYKADSPAATLDNLEEARFVMFGSKTLVLKSQICPTDYFQYYGTSTLDELLEKNDKDVGVSGGDKHQVKELQRFLEALGIDVGNNGTDGWFGNDTENAVKAFQRAKGLTEIGKIDTSTKTMINASCHDKIP